MKFFYINLEERTDRKKFIEDQAKKLNIETERVNAIDKNNPIVKDHLARNLFNGVNASAMACTLSHISAWRKILDQKLEFAIVLEDDAIISPSILATLVGIESSFASSNFDLIRLETSGDKFISLSPPQITLPNKVKIYKFYSSQSGTAGYVISSFFIRKIINQSVLYATAIDALFFMPKSNFLNKYNIFQAVPAPIIQTWKLNQKENAKISLSNIQSLSESKQKKQSFMTATYLILTIPIKLIMIVSRTKKLPNDMFLFPFSLLYKFHTLLKIIFSKCARKRVPFA
jgi:glycosyl transferase family 25